MRWSKIWRVTRKTFTLSISPSRTPTDTVADPKAHAEADTLEVGGDPVGLGREAVGANAPGQAWSNRLDSRVVDEDNRQTPEGQAIREVDDGVLHRRPGFVGVRLNADEAVQHRGCVIDVRPRILMPPGVRSAITNTPRVLGSIPTDRRVVSRARLVRDGLFRALQPSVAVAQEVA